MTKLLRILVLLLSPLAPLPLPVTAQVLTPPQPVFNRIIHGWTNYSTAFNATHDIGAAADYASVGTLFTPAADLVPAEYAVMVVGSGTRAPAFARFQFRVMVWTSLAAFISEPRQGNLATWNFTTPTGGSPSVPDTTTRGGRPAYELRFSLTNGPITLSHGHTYLIGFAALADTQTADELFVPTSGFEGPSDVQAGDLVVGGWRYLVNAGGSTVYSGQLAVALKASPVIHPVTLETSRAGSLVHLSWPASGTNFLVEYSLALPTSGGAWFPVDTEPFEENGKLHVVVPASFHRQWFRLRRDP